MFKGISIFICIFDGMVLLIYRKLFIVVYRGLDVIRIGWVHVFILNQCVVGLAGL